MKRQQKKKDTKNCVNFIFVFCCALEINTKTMLSKFDPHPTAVNNYS